MPPLFQGYIAVDWSVAATPGQDENSIWIASLLPGEEVQLENPRCRTGAMVRIEQLLDEANDRGHRLLCGFDFAFGYPVGTAQMMTGHDNWEAVWELIAEFIEDDIDNQPNLNNRFEAAAVLNDAFPGEGPFWGLPNGWQINGLLPTGPDGWGERLPPEHRYADQAVPAAQTVWHLFGPGTVGSQALMGIKRLQELRHLRQNRNDVHVWPFQTLGEGRHHVLAEIYPSLILPMPGNEVLDRRQMHAAALRLRDLDAEGHLVQRLHAPERMPEAVQREEALFLDITIRGNVFAQYMRVP